VHAAEQQRPDVKARRGAWADTLAAAGGGGEFARASFLDGSGAVTSLARTHGRRERGERGERGVGPVPRGHGKVMTAVAAVRPGRGLVAPFTIDGPVDGDVFTTYVERVLAPTPRPGDAWW
jgi:hypothetical protein